jgi:hypothetical protein
LGKQSSVKEEKIEGFFARLFVQPVIYGKCSCVALGKQSSVKEEKIEGFFARLFVQPVTLGKRSSF